MLAAVVVAGLLVALMLLLRRRRAPPPKSATAVVVRALSPSDARELARRCSSLPFRSGRHSSYATVDFPLHEDPGLEEALLPATRRLVSAAASFGGLREEWLWVREQFVVRYAPEEQEGLEWHVDASLMSFVLALSEDFEGGGTLLESTAGPISPRPGEAVVFCGGATRHMAAPTRRGVRLVVAGFLDYHAPVHEWERLRATRALARVERPLEPVRPYCLFNVRRLETRGAFDGWREVGEAWPHARVDALRAAIGRTKKGPGPTAARLREELTDPERCADTGCFAR